MDGRVDILRYLPEAFLCAFTLRHVTRSCSALHQVTGVYTAHIRYPALLSVGAYKSGFQAQACI
jgi:hypothetical protein